MEINTNFMCKICDKPYASMSSLCNHNKKFHTEDNLIPSKSILESESKKYKCKYCVNAYKSIQNRWDHEQKCKINHEKQKRLKEEEKVLKLQIKINQSSNITYKSLQRLNNRIKQTNISLCNFGNEKLHTLLNEQTQIRLFNTPHKLLDYLINMTYCMGYIQFQNVIITNLKDNNLYIYDDECNQFIAAPKDQTLNKIIWNRVSDIWDMFEKLCEKKKMNQSIKDRLDECLEPLNHPDKIYINSEGTTYLNFQQYHTNKLKYILFNLKNTYLENVISLLPNTTTPT
jgi:hypothetical protein